MAEVVIVAVALGGVSAYVWSVIAQADAPPESSALRTMDLRSALRVALRRGAAMTATAAALAQSGTRAIQARWAGRARRKFEPRGRRIRFAETAELTGPEEPMLAGPPAATVWGGWQDRPSRLTAAVELVLLIVVVGAVVAALIFGLGELVARAVHGSRGA